MSSTTETPDLDKKKEDSTTDTTKKIGNIGGFFKLFIILTVIVLLYFGSSGLVLYACKLSQSNILPTDMNCYPYTNVNPTIQKVFSNIFTSSPFVEPQVSMKINFPYDDNKKNVLLDMLRDYKNQPTSNFIANYFIAIIEGLVSFNNSYFNTVLNTMNANLPEIAIVLLGPLLMAFFTNIILVLDNIYLIHLWISNFSWFFKRNGNDKDDQPPSWKTVTLSEPGSYLFSFWLVSVFATIGILLFFFAFPIVAILPFVILMITIFSGLAYKGEITDEGKVSALSIVGGVMKSYKVMLMSIISFIVTISAFSRLGVVEGIWSIVIVLLIFWGVLSIDIFKPVNQSYLSALVSDVQAKKSQCKLKEEVKSKGFFYNLTHPQYLFKSQNGGKRLVSELTKLGQHVRTLQ